VRKITVIENVTLDGVMQAPGRSDEDTRDGFTHGGWALPYDDMIKAEAMGRGMAGDAVRAVDGLKRRGGCFTAPPPALPQPLGLR